MELLLISTILFLLHSRLATGFLSRSGPRNVASWSQRSAMSVIERAGRRHPTKLAWFAGNTAVPKSVNARNKEMADSVKAAIANPRVPSCKLIECEFPALAALNKLGDGSLRSAIEADDANIEASLVIARSFLPAPFGPGKVWMVPSRSSSERMKSLLKQKWNSVHDLSQGTPPVKSRDVCIFVSPSSPADYDAAASLTANGNAVVVVNGQAKVSGMFVFGQHHRPQDTSDLRSLFDEPTRLPNRFPTARRWPTT
jgi:hypothetical protein